MWYVISEDELYHHGIKGQKWGVRRFQNPDGTLTEEGRKRYNVYSDGQIKKKSNKTIKLESRLREQSNSNKKEKIQKKLNKSIKNDKHKTARTLVKIGAAAALTGLAAYGVYKISTMKNDSSITSLVSEGKSSVQAYHDNKIREEVDKIITPKAEQKAYDSLAEPMLESYRSYRKRTGRELYNFSSLEEKYDALPDDKKVARIDSDSGKAYTVKRLSGNGFVSPVKRISIMMQAGLVPVDGKEFESVFKSHYDKEYAEEYVRQKDKYGKPSVYKTRIDEILGL